MTKRAYLSLSVVAGCLLCCLLAIVVLPAPPAGAILDRYGRVVLLEVLILLLITTVPVVIRIRVAGIRALVEPLSFMSATILIYYALRGLALLFRNALHEQDVLMRFIKVPNSVLALALAYAIAGAIAFHIGYRFWKPPVPNPASGGRLDNLNRLAIGCTVIACVSTYVLIYLAGGFANTLRSFGCLRLVAVGYGYLLIGMNYWSIVFSFLLMDRLRRSKNIIVPLILLVIANLCDAFIGNRTGMLASWITAILLFFLLSKTGNVLRSAIVCTCFVGLAVGVALPLARIRQFGCPEETGGPSRKTIAQILGVKPSGTSGERSISSALQITNNYWKEAHGGVAVRALGEFVALDSFATMISVGPQKFPFRYGGTYLDSILFVVPRSIWPNKPRAFSYAIGQHILGIYTDIPPGFLGELYINFHLPGILAGMYLMGLFLRGAHRWILSGDPIAITTYSILIPFLILFMGRSFIGGGTLTVILTFLVLPFVLFSRRRQPSRSPQNNSQDVQSHTASSSDRSFQQA